MRVDIQQQERHSVRNALQAITLKIWWGPIHVSHVPGEVTVPKWAFLQCRALALRVDIQRQEPLHARYAQQDRIAPPRAFLRYPGTALRVNIPLLLRPVVKAAKRTRMHLPLEQQTAPPARMVFSLELVRQAAR